MSIDSKASGTLGMIVVLEFVVSPPREASEFRGAEEIARYSPELV
jgi:hypothetical protein